MQEIIPTLGEKIIVELIEHHKKTGFFLFSIKVQGISCIELRLTGETIGKIAKIVANQMDRNIKRHC